MRTRRSTQLLVVITGLLIAGGLNVSAVGLGEALDNTNSVWTSGGNNVWFGTNASAAPTFDGVDGAASGAIGDDETSWLETTVTGPGELRFWWAASTEEIYDPVIFYVDGVEVNQISGEQNWQYYAYTITNSGTVTLRWEYTRDFAFPGGLNKAYLDQVKFTTGPEIPLATAVNTASFAWTTAGNINPTYWEGQTNVSRADGKAAESGAVTTSQESWMETTVSNVSNVSFWWKVSSVTNHGWLRFYVDNVQQFQISGEVGWQLKTNIALAPGIHTLRWTCATDELAIGKLNRGWVDEIAFTMSAPSAPITLGTPVLLADGKVQFNVNFEAGWPCTVLYSTNPAEGGWTTLLVTNTTSSVTLVTDSSATNSPSGRFYRAQSP